MSREGCKSGKLTSMEEGFKKGVEFGRKIKKRLEKSSVTMEISYRFKCLITGIKKETPPEVLLQLQGLVIYDGLFRLGVQWHRACFHHMLMRSNCYHK